MIELNPVKEYENVDTQSDAFDSVENVAEDKINDKSLRTIVVQNLKHPGGWLRNRQFQMLLNRCVIFDVSFSRPEDTDEKQIKYGKVEFVFSTVAGAREAYSTIQKMIIDGIRPEALVDPQFFSVETFQSSRQFFDISNDTRLVFLLDAPKSIDDHMISYFFEGKTPIHFQTLPMPSSNGLFQVEVLLSDKETAEKVLAGPSKFSMSDEDNECTVTLLSPREYSLYSKMDDIQQSTSAKKPLKQSYISENVGQTLAPEIDEDVISNRLLEIIDERKLNFAEINEKNELYELCDTVSSEYNGVPDSILKPAMGSVLQKHLNRTEMHWMREHLEGLLRVWKIEILNEQTYERPSFVPMETVAYQPVVEEQKTESTSKGAEKRQRAARKQMGVAAFLNANRDRLIVETGDVDMDSDDDGNVTIGGEALSFDSWARITKTKASGVVRANDDGSKKIGNGGLSKKQMRQARIVEGMSQEEWKKWRNEKSSNRKADIKQRIMARGAIIDEGEIDNETAVNGNSEVAIETVEPSPTLAAVKRILDEGEIDSDEEKQQASKSKKKKPATSDSSDSTSSSSEEDFDGPVDARKRRKLRRKKDRKNPRTTTASSLLDPTFRQMFENRKTILAQMTPAHKSAFVSALTQIVNNNPSGVSQAKASQVINTMMSGFK
ncbi:Small Nuclear RNA (snRNA) Associated protein [Caenorhabditis elegans]|uniref:Small Nuclear RNA (snRNA) Associated protein n=1 Tax=Caenorhabditis elegans TaxID=6239 RepID=Q94050_CAEEL|nr:Small Nuclear RNA (snRNA) Associated protein [Caenorhabditis elegans]CAB03358.1 Small Nuclear RNA (snRNA) Associated protein [Caenorhabditis elegans]|eukprot:NP_501744.1 Small Nuclear RNA (snRNA) Associated protein [Caenorhabditis elegans]